MMYRLLPVVFLFGAASIPAAAQEHAAQCAERTKIIAGLAKQYQESPVAMGLDSSGSIIEITASEDGGTWTALVSRPDGVSCMVAAGQHWEMDHAPRVARKSIEN